MTDATNQVETNAVQDDEIARRRANEGLGRQTPLETKQGLQDDAIAQAGLLQQQPQPAEETPAELKSEAAGKPAPAAPIADDPVDDETGHVETLEERDLRLAGGKGGNASRGGK